MNSSNYSIENYRLTKTINIVGFYHKYILHAIYIYTITSIDARKPNTTVNLTPETLNKHNVKLKILKQDLYSMDFNPIEIINIF